VRAIPTFAIQEAGSNSRSDLSGECRLVRWRGGLTTSPSSRPPSTSGTRATQRRRPAEVPARPGPARRAGGSRRARRPTRPRRAAGGGGPRKTRAGSGRTFSSSPGNAYPGPGRITFGIDLSVSARPQPAVVYPVIWTARKFTNVGCAKTYVAFHVPSGFWDSVIPGIPPADRLERQHGNVGELAGREGELARSR
jgi:hypothetical protein